MGCGVFGAVSFNEQPVFPYVYWGLRSQNHRGHQSHGFLTYYDGKFNVHKNLDLVPKIKIKTIQEWIKRLPGNIGIGNVRYTTSGKCDEESIIQGTQPVQVSIDGVELAVSFNGNIVNTLQLSQEITQHVSNFSCSCDSDLIANKLLLELIRSEDLKLAVESVIGGIEGAFSVVGITGKGELFAFKDPHGIRPLCAGHSPDGLIFAFASETVGLDINGLTCDFELAPGELVTVSKKDFHRQQIVQRPRKAFCAFEFAYFARPDSWFNGKYVYEIREAFGRNLVREFPGIVRVADIVLSVPETGDDPAMGVHEESGLRWERASRRHRYVTERAFILLNNERYSTINRKVNILGSKVEGKRIIVTEDSIVRGDTTRIIIEKLRKSGAKKVYMFVTFPRIIGPCLYGIDMATYGQLIGSRHDDEEVARLIGADSVCYQSIENLVKSAGCTCDDLCLACITGEYPTPLAQKMANESKDRFRRGYPETNRVYETDRVFQGPKAKRQLTN